MSADVTRAPRGARRAWLAAGAASALLVAAWLVAFVTPTEVERDAPFVTTMVVGEEASGRNLSVTIQDVRLAHSVHTDEWAADASSLWLVFDLQAAAVRDDVGTLLGGATLRVGDRTYSASERPDSLRREGLSTGIPTSGVLAFELPGDATDAGRAVLDLSMHDDVRLDSVLRLDVDLAALEVASDVELAPTEWGG